MSKQKKKVVDLFAALKESLDNGQRYCDHCGDKLTPEQKQCDDECATGAGHFICGGTPVLFSSLKLELQQRWTRT